jgi:hypothetical protein
MNNMFVFQHPGYSARMAERTLEVMKTNRSQDRYREVPFYLFTLSLFLSFSLEGLCETRLLFVYFVDLAHSLSLYVLPLID